MGAVSSMCCKDDHNNQPLSKSKLQPKPNREPAPKTIEKPKVKEELQPEKTVETINNDKKVVTWNDEQLPKKQEEKQKPNQEKNSIKWENFQITNLIGQGGFGEVFLGELKENQLKGLQEKYAIKRILKSRILDKKLLQSIKLQKDILQGSNSNFITSLHYAFRDEKYLYLVMELAEGGDTYSLIREKSQRFKDYKKAGEDAVRFLLGCLILGMEYLHSNKIIYRDLKPENLLMFSNGYVKMTDFGLAKELKENIENRTEAGTTFYYAPEMVLRQNYGREIDLWAIGIFAYEMSNYCPPFSGPEIKDKQRVKQLVKVAQANRNWKNPNVSEQLKSFINSLLRFDPQQRLGSKSWSDVKSHSFFTSVNFDWQALEQMKMPSPLKPIIDSHPMKFKTYTPKINPQNHAKHHADLDKDLPCWTEMNNNLHA